MARTIDQQLADLTSIQLMRSWYRSRKSSGRTPTEDDIRFKVDKLWPERTPERRQIIAEQTTR